MINTRLLLFLVLVPACWQVWSQIPPDQIDGEKSITLVKPLSNDVAVMIRDSAAQKFGAHLRMILSDYYNTPRDSGDPLQSHYVESFITRCRAGAENKSAFSGRTWTARYSLTADSLKSMIALHNAQYDFRAMHDYTLLLDAERAQNYLEIFKYAVRSLCLSSAHIGEPLKNPGTGEILADDAKIVLQKCLDKLSVSTSTLVMEGSCGVTRTDPLTIEVKIDTIPFAGFAMLARIPRVIRPFALYADKNGTTTLPSFTIPYAAFKGTFLSIEPNFGAVLDSSRGMVLTAADLGISLSPAMVIFKTVSPTYQLDYMLNAANNMPIPKEFQQGTALKNYLRDTCTLKPAAEGSAGADLSIAVQCQVSSYTYDETEETVVKAEAQITIKENRANGRTLQRILIVNQHGYDYRNDLPVGAFLWETMGKLKQSVRAMLYEM
jgi:hypothetical protein